jgi:beta-lactamase regulating signal transducer with metallopeptidase domain
VDTLLETGLVNALLATGLALLAAGAGRFCRRPALVHGLWLLVLLKLVTPLLLYVHLPWWADRRPDDAGQAAVRLPDHPSRDPQGAVRWAPRENPSRDRQGAVVRLVPLPGGRGSEREEGPLAGGRGSERADVGRNAGPAWQPVLLAVWAAGCLACWGAAAWRIGRFRRLCRFATTPPAPLVAQVERLARRLGLRRCPQIAFLPAPVSPLLWALGPVPRLFLPAALWPALTAEQREALLVHELAHLRRRDHWVRRLELVVLGLYWWHPVAWWARRELREAEEQCCDAWVVWALPGSAAAYAAALVQTVTFLSRARCALPAAASGIGHVHSLKRRLTMILRTTPPRALSGAGLLAVLGLGALLLPLVPTRAGQTASEAPADRPAAKKSASRTQAPIALDFGVPAKKTVGRTTSEAKANPGARSEPATADRSEQLEKARDEVELLAAELDAKKAEYQEAQARLRHAQLALGRLAKLARAKAVSEEEMGQARADVEVREARLAGKKAEYRAAEIRLAQGRRRLAKLQRQPQHGAAPGPKTKARGLLCIPGVADLGVVHRGTDAACKFLLVNNTAEPLEIGTPRLSCACATAKCDRHLLDRGATAVLTCRVDSRRFTGTKHIKIYVPYTTEQGSTGETALTVRADSREATREDDKAAGPVAPDRARLKKLEDKVQTLLKEIGELRQEMRPKKNAGRDATDPNR